MDGAAGDSGGQAPMGALRDRLAGAREARLRDAVLRIAGDVHCIVSELRASPAELRAALDFLTDVGHATDQRRQEWVLLADVLGLSSAVEDMAAPDVPGATPQTLAGPFYRADAPDLAAGADLCRDGRGVALRVSGQVAALDGGPVGGALVEVWHANGEGFYENQEPDLQPEFNLRGRFRADAAGRFHFRTIRPSGYALPEDGPVGRLMNRLGVRLERPAHLHFRITAPGFRPLVTHVFDRDDPAIGRDALFGVKPGLLAGFRPEGDGFAVETRFVLCPEDRR